jgi:hypothetical protein
MKQSREALAAITLALRRPDTVLAAVAALHGCTETAATEGLIELLYQPPTARAGVAAIAALDGCNQSIVVDALLHVLGNSHSSLRLAAIEALDRRGTIGPQLRSILQQDESWPVRRAALRAVASGPERWAVLDAADDPHWRVRHALIEVLMRRGDAEPSLREEITQRLAGSQPRIQGLRRYLGYRWTGNAQVESLAGPPRPIAAQPFWDWDAFVLFRNLERLTEAECRQVLDWMPELLFHPDDRVAGLALDTLWRWGEARQFAAAIALLEEPRTGSTTMVAKLLAKLDQDQIDDTIRLIQNSPASSPAALVWAEGKQLEAVAGASELAKRVVQAESLLQAGIAEDDPRLLRLQGDPHPYVRAAALTPTRAAALIHDPLQETSWHVLAKAARLMKTPLWKLEPAEQWQPVKASPAIVEPLQPQCCAPPRPRPLGPARLPVAPLGISGHYGLPVAGFVRALEAGVNLLFWEPNYATLTEFSGRLSPSVRGSLHFIAGTFEADGQRVERDAERALRLLRLERISIFLMFWVRGWNRITADVRQALERLKEQGKIGDFGLSTHSRPLAVEAMQAGWNPVMVRHSVAHRGAETHVLPKALELGTSIITFNNTCYGRLLKAKEAPPTAADCYRYTLAQPGVTACLSAPATLEQLEENLRALHEPKLPDERRARMLLQGDVVYREDTIFRKLVREV